MKVLLLPSCPESDSQKIVTNKRFLSVALRKVLLRLTVNGTYLLPPVPLKIKY